MGVATLGSTIKADLELFGACTGRRRRVLIDMAGLEALAARYGHAAVLFDVAERIICRDCGGKVDLSVYGSPRYAPTLK